MARLLDHVRDKMITLKGSGPKKMEILMAFFMKGGGVSLAIKFFFSFLRILLKQNTALLSHVSASVSHRRDISRFLDNLIL